MKIWKKTLLTVLALAYAIHLIILMAWQLFPIARQEHGGKIYTIKHGFGYYIDFIPVIGLAPLMGEPVILTIKDRATGVKTWGDFDLATDVYTKYPEVFANKK